MMSKTKSKSNPPCIQCGSAEVIKHGSRKNKIETLPLYFCKVCSHTFTGQNIQGKTYPLKIILAALSYYHHGHSLAEVSALLKKKFRKTIGKSTIGSWVTDFKPLCTYNRLRPKGIKLFTPDQIINTVALPHKQVYDFSIHRAKLQLLLEPNTHQRFKPFKEYLEDMTINCPHDLFLGPNRSSKTKAGFHLNQVQIREKSNNAIHIAQMAVPTAPNNRARHDTLQRFMLANDSATVATEVPIYLTPEDIDHLNKQLKFIVPLSTEEPITGHIDIVQIRRNAIHVLDYKPNARKEKKAIDQLMVYALALSRRTGLRLFDFKCAWFDDKDYFEFYPLHVVYKLLQK